MNGYPKVRNQGSLQDIANYIHKFGPTRQPELARQMGISRAAVNVHMARLRESGLVMTVGSSQGSRGRPSDLLAINVQSNGVAVIYLGDAHLNAGLANLNQEMLWQDRVHLSENVDNESLLKLLIEKVDHIRAEAHARGVTLRYAVISVAGKVDPRDGSIEVSTHFPNLHNMQIESRLQEVLGVPLKVFTGASTLSAGALLQCGPDVNRINIVEWGYGVGWTCSTRETPFGAIFPDWRPFSHIKVVPEGHRCYCGEQGCLEAEVGVRGILKQWEESGFAPAGAGLETLQSALDAQDEKVIALVEMAACRLGDHLSLLVQMSNPEVLMVESLFAGDLNRWREAFLRGLWPRLHRSQAEKLKVEFFPAASISRVTGAFFLAEQLFFDPELIRYVRVSGDYGAKDARSIPSFKDMLKASEIV